MVHGYHVIFGAYGFWLPNDPRGSWSKFVGKWELVRFGKTTRFGKRREFLELTVDERRHREAARRSLKYPAVQFSGDQALAIAQGFGNACQKSGYEIWSCAILPEHTHLVIARHSYETEKVANLLKGAATRQVIDRGVHPLTNYLESQKGRPPRMWAKGQWIAFLDSESAIDEAIVYVEGNPEKENKPKQYWSFVTPFEGLPSGWVSYQF